MTANPQLENGHTDIANELVDVIARTYFSPAESKVFWTVLRMTYGWHKKSDRISYSMFENVTGLDRRHISPALKRLQARNIITCVSAGEKRINEYAIQKDYERWILSPIPVIDSVTHSRDRLEKSVTDSGDKSITSLSNNLSPEQVIDGGGNLSPVTVPSVTSLGQSVTDSGDKSVTSLSNHQNKENILPKHITKESARDAPLPDKKPGKEIYGLPDYVDANTWDDYLAMRKKRRAAPTDRAVELIIKDLEGFHGDGYDVNKLLEMSIKNSWIGVFPRKEFLPCRTGTNTRQLPKVYTRPEDYGK
jgi:phage replication O-like protein O